MLPGNVVAFLEDGRLDVKVLGHSFDDEIGLGNGLCQPNVSPTWHANRVRRTSMSGPNAIRCKDSSPTSCVNLCLATWPDTHDLQNAFESSSAPSFASINDTANC